MREVSNRIAILIKLVEYIIAEEFDDVAIASFRPTRIASESVNVETSTMCSGQNSLGSFVDETELA